MNTNFIFIGLTQLGIQPKSTAPEVNAQITRTSELLRPSELTTWLRSSTLALWNHKHFYYVTTVFIVGRYFF